MKMTAEEFWTLVVKNEKKLKITINKMSSDLTDNDEFFQEAVLRTYERIITSDKPFNGKNALGYITIVAKNLIIHANDKSMMEIDVNYFDNENEEEIQPMPDELIFIDEDNNRQLLEWRTFMKEVKAKKVWDKVLVWLNDPKNVSHIEAGIFKYRMMTNHSTAKIAELSGFSTVNIYNKTAKVLRLLQEHFKNNKNI